LIINRKKFIFILPINVLLIIKNYIKFFQIYCRNISEEWLVGKYILYQSVLGKIKIDFRTDFISCICCNSTYVDTYLDTYVDSDDIMILCDRLSQRAA